MQDAQLNAALLQQLDALGPADGAPDGAAPPTGAATWELVERIVQQHGARMSYASVALATLRLGLLVRAGRGPDLDAGADVGRYHALLAELVQHVARVSSWFTALQYAQVRQALQRFPRSCQGSASRAEPRRNLPRAACTSAQVAFGMAACGYADRAFWAVFTASAERKLLACNGRTLALLLTGVGEGRRRFRVRLQRRLRRLQFVRWWWCLGLRRSGADRRSRPPACPAAAAGAGWVGHAPTLQWLQKSEVQCGRHWHHTSHADLAAVLWAWGRCNYTPTKCVFLCFSDAGAPLKQLTSPPWPGCKQASKGARAVAPLPSAARAARSAGVARPSRRRQQAKRVLPSLLLLELQALRAAGAAARAAAKRSVVRALNCVRAAGPSRGGCCSACCLWRGRAGSRRRSCCRRSTLRHGSRRTTPRRRGCTPGARASSLTWARRVYVCARGGAEGGRRGCTTGARASSRTWDGRVCVCTAHGTWWRPRCRGAPERTAATHTLAPLPPTAHILSNLELPLRQGAATPRVGAPPAAAARAGGAGRAGRRAAVPGLAAAPARARLHAQGAAPAPRRRPAAALRH